MALLSLVVSFFSTVYDTFGLDHPRAFQPQECANLTPQLQQQISFEHSQDVISIANCINNQNVNCYCSIDMPYGSNLSQLRCGGREWISSANACEFYTNSPLNPNQTLMQYCLINQSIQISTNTSLVSDLILSCRTKGLDLLNAPVLWGATILILCIEAIFKLAMILGIFNKE
jgi:hypothetical protein